MSTSSWSGHEDITHRQVCRWYFRTCEEILRGLRQAIILDGCLFGTVVQTILMLYSHALLPMHDHCQFSSTVKYGMVGSLELPLVTGVMSRSYAINPRSNTSFFISLHFPFILMIRQPCIVCRYHYPARTFHASRTK